ncbi:hypothetical protein M0811_09343 [Anaeramoeba ignava]|uniref:N-acetyltransferase domain-containing protein n=1 Tax=Anaeramoeba ignava TaxID=1746090 RepID=A0A9Q0RA97_ANAIG|nr:hypothetical protein M0811_09343 [Anaeramoeba ignava]
MEEIKKLQENRENQIILETKNLLIDTLKEEDIEEAVECVSTSFAERELMSIVLGISKKEWDPLTIQIVELGVKCGLSVVAREKQTNKFVGCFLSQDVFDDSKIEFSKLCSKWEPLWAILDEFNKHKENIKKGEYLHLWTISVNEEFKGKKFANSISYANLILGAQNKFKYGISEATAPGSQAAFRKLGFEEKDYIKYSSYKYKEKYPFEFLEGGVSFVMKPLQNILKETKTKKTLFLN